MEPLRWPEGLRRRTAIDYVLEFIPLIGPAFSPAGRQEAPAIEHITEQLLERKEPNPEIWGSEPLRQEIARSVCRLTQKEFDWPNDRFIPEDPVDIVFQVPWEDLQIIEFIMSLEEELDIAVSDDDSMAWKTLGDVVDTAWSKVLSAKPPGSSQGTGSPH